MTKHKSYIPQKNGEFDVFFKNIVQYLDGKIAEPDGWTHIPEADRKRLTDAYSAWYTAYARTLTPHTPPETREKNRVKKEAEKVLRDFVNRFLRYPPVTDQDRDNMGIPNHTTGRVSQGTPTEMVEFSFRIKSFRQVLIDFKVEGSLGKAKPYGYEGAEVIWAVLDHAPATHAELTLHDLVNRTPFTLLFDETERGKTVYAALAWRNSKGQKGPWSVIQSTIVP